MISYCIDSFESAKRLVSICEKYKETEISILCGKQIIDGKSILGVMSLVGNIVSVEIETDDNEVKEKFVKGIKNGI